MFSIVLLLFSIYTEVRAVLDCTKWWWYVHLMSTALFDAWFSGCLSGYYGAGCQFQCSCAANASCDAVTGSCRCPLGHFGEHCQHGLVAHLSLYLLLRIFYINNKLVIVVLFDTASHRPKLLAKIIYCCFLAFICCSKSFCIMCLY